MNIHDHKLRSLTVSKVYKEPSVTTSKFGKVFTQIKETFSNQHKEEYLLILTCDHIAILRAGSDSDANGSTSVNPTTSSSKTLEEAYSTSSHLSDVSNDYGASNSLVLSVSLSHVTKVGSEGSQVSLQFVSSAGHKGASSDPFAPVPVFPVLASISDRFTGLVSELDLNSFSASNRTMTKQAAVLGGILPVQNVTLWTDSDEDAASLSHAIRNAMRRLIDALLWLDRGLPLYQDICITVASVDSFSSLGEGWSSGQQIISRRPAWGTWLTLPPLQLPSKSPSDIPDALQFYLDLSTPLGPCHVAVPISRIIKAVTKELGRFVVQAHPEASTQSNDLDSFQATQEISVDISCLAECKWCDSKTERFNAPTAASLPPQRSQSRLGSAGGRRIALAGLMALCSLALLLPILEHPLLAISIAACMSLGAYFSGIIESLPVPDSHTSAAGHNESRSSAPEVANIRVKLIRGELVEEPAVCGDELSAGEQEVPLIDSPDGGQARVGEPSLQVASSIGRMSSLAGNFQGTHVPLVDLGAVSFRRVVTVSLASLDVSVEKNIAAVVDDGEITGSEGEELLLLAARSPVATPDLFLRYVAACSGCRDTAMHRLRATVEWRMAHNIDAVLRSPIPAFFDIKDAYVHAIVSFTRDGLPVVVEGMGGFRFTMAKLREKNVTPRQMLHQFVFVMEFITRRLDPSPYPRGKFVRIYDFKGIGLGDISDSEAVGLGKQMMDILEQYYPERMAKAFVVNIPSFFSILWRMARPMLDPRTAEKITVVSGKKAALAALRTVMDDDAIPQEYGGTGVAHWYDSPEEERIAVLAAQLTSR